MSSESHTWYSVCLPPMKNYQVCLHSPTGHAVKVRVQCLGTGTFKHAASKYRDLNLTGPSAQRAIKAAQEQRTQLWEPKS